MNSRRAKSAVVFLLLLITFLNARLPASAGNLVFDAKPHNDVTIEWWYLNAHVTTDKGRHLAVIGCFFKFGNASGQFAEDVRFKAPQSFYLIYGVTDCATKSHVAYSLADKNTLVLLQQAVSMMVLQNPSDQKAQAVLTMLNKGKLPPPTRLLPGRAYVSGSPFQVEYGPDDTVTEAPGKLNTFELKLDAPDPNGMRLNLVFGSTRPPMYVNGNGNTGLVKPTDMKYVSLSRCTVSGSIVDHGAVDAVQTGVGWIDHQWGESWTGQKVGWDWWGVQLADGEDINMFQMHDLATGRYFFPSATFEDKNGKESVVHKVTFTPIPRSDWTSPRTGISYALQWRIEFPERGLTLTTSPVMQDQEMPLIGGKAIWEGYCTVTGKQGSVAISGVAYQELVGYQAEPGPGAR